MIRKEEKATPEGKVTTYDINWTSIAAGIAIIYKAIKELKK